MWEITLACNLRCQYCGSAAGKRRENELTTEQSLDVCNSLARLEAERVTLMGGEPLIRKDWACILEKLNRLNIKTDIVSNGHFIDQEVAFKLREVNVYSVSLSLDGPPEIHDRLRSKEGQYSEVERAVQNLQETGVSVGIITHINTVNFPYLEKLYQTLVDWQVDGWQLQLTSPLGFAKESDCMIGQSELVQLHDWAEDKQKDKALHFYFADDIGYFHRSDPKLRRGFGRNSVWLGCQAGLSTVGIASNGDVRACMSLPEEFTEANVLKRPLEEIWNDPEMFRFNRQGHQLAGHCASCPYGEVCRGGCCSSAYAVYGKLGEMPLCWYRSTVEFTP